MNKSAYPVIDLFAGPGGLGEGFAAFAKNGGRAFRIALSIEKDPQAHGTLSLRAFFRTFDSVDNVPSEYYEHLRGGLSRDELFSRFSRKAASALEEAWLAELGAEDPTTVDRRVQKAIKKRDDWVLIGGPPCQAYSLVGRSRMRGADPEKYEKDPRHFLYREYLRILGAHRPPVFVMENVKGLLSATVAGKGMFQRIVEDLQQPMHALRPGRRDSLRYRLYALAPSNQASLTTELPDRPSDFIVRCENYGLPQARHRIIIVGIRDDLRAVPRKLQLARSTVPAGDVILDLPPIRSIISRDEDSTFEWVEAVRECAALLKRETVTRALAEFIRRFSITEEEVPGTGAEFMCWRSRPKYRSDWYTDTRLGGICNHTSRSHLRSDIQRYFFAASFAASGNGSGRSPVISDFPEFLLPLHENVEDAVAGVMFSDRFRVQVAGRPSTTITSHISKDGHYYIHPDPRQARSLSVREAARLQTFPDNYLFCGPRTSQYQQVGNAVPPLLAVQVAEIIEQILS